MKKSTFAKFLKNFAQMLIFLALLSTLVSLIFSGFKWFTSFENFIHRISYGFIIGLCFGLGNWGVGVFTGKRLNWKKNLKRSNFISLMSFIFVGILVSVFVPYFFGKYSFGLTGEKLRYHVTINAFTALSIDMIAISIYYSYYLVHFWKKSLDRYENIERENLKAKYDALKSQVNPHFLFNSLNTLAGVVEKDQQKAVDFIKRLSDTYRYVLEQRDKEVVKISDELSFLENYIYLARMRHGKGLNYNCQITSPHKFIAPLGLQILVENCIKHNVINDENPLNISIMEEGDYLIVTNNLQKKTTVKENHSLGLENLKNRYAYISDEPVVTLVENNNYIAKIPIVENTVL